ncbi:MAG: HAD-IA family hydrolase [Deltaproteobacteria bacterium]|nr:HAD-IA family hydrolase [Deltaproteobacteria bacterium]
MRRVIAVIFDCDGVLFDSRQANTLFYNHILAHFGLPPMREEEEAFVHMHTADESIRYIFRGTGYEKQALRYRMEMDYAPFIQGMIPEPDLLELLRALTPTFGLAIATNRSNTISNVLQTHGLEDLFDIVISSLDVRHPKPHPECLLKILHFFQITPEQAIYVGDSLVDSQTARAAGVRFVAYKDPALEADYHVSGLMDIAGLLGITRRG